MGYPSLKPEAVRQIVFCMDKGLSTVETADLLGVSQASCVYAFQMVKAFRDGDAEALAVSIKKSKSENMARLVAAALNVDYDTFRAPKNAPEPPKAEPDPNALLVLEKLTGCMGELRDGMKELSKSLAQIQLAVQGMRQEQNDRLTKIVEAVNVNGDIVSKEHDRLALLVDSIKGNVKGMARKGNVE